MVDAETVIRLHREAGVAVSVAKAALEAATSYQAALRVLAGPQDEERDEERTDRADEMLALRFIKKKTGIIGDEARALLERADGDLSRALRLTNRISTAEAIRRLESGRALSGVEVHGLRISGSYERLKFEGATLMRPTFEDLKVERLELRWCELTQPTFLDVTVSEDFKANGCTVDVLRIKRGSVGGSLNLSDSDIGLVEIRSLTVTGRFRAWDTHFTRWVNFRDVTFGGVADFRALTCDEGLVLEDCRFESDLLLRGAHVSGRFDLRGSEARGCIDLERSKLHDFVYLQDVVAGPDQTWRFLNMLGSGALIRRDQVEGRLASELEADYDTASAEYSLLRRVWGDLDRHREEDWAFHQFKVASRRAVTRSWRRPWTKISEFFEWIFLDKGCGYGTNPLRALYTGGLVVVLFALLYAAGIESFVRTSDLVSEFSLSEPQERLVFGFLISASVFAANFEQVALASGWMALAILIEAGLGLLLFGLFVVAFSRKVIR